MTPFTSPGEEEYEVWANGCFNPPRVLVVVSAGDEGPFKVVDPCGDNATVFTAKDFVEVVDYLREEDYERVRGRMRFDACGDDD
jgi:hypothetical protein